MCRDDGGGIDAFIRNAPCAFNYIIYPIFVQCYVMDRFGHENGPFWMLAGAVLVLFFLPLGPFWFAWAVFDLHWGRFGRFPLSSEHVVSKQLAQGPLLPVLCLSGKKRAASI